MFTLNDISPFLLSTAKENFTASEVDFNSARDSALEIIKSKVAIDPELPFPKSLILPAAWIAGYLNVQTSSSINPDEQGRYETLYNRALKMLNDLTVKSTNYSIVEIKGVHQW